MLRSPSHLRMIERIVTLSLITDDGRHKALRLPDQIKLLPSSTDDAVAAQLAFASYQASGSSASAQQVRTARCPGLA